ncbi:MAG TPA: hypothetical protein VKU88_04365 [Acidimicrobiales bacterium]|nr:hypothetical protein [Acidimicrobiales bacterium]
MIDRAIRFLLRRSWRKGVLEGSAAWVAVGGAAALGYLARRGLKREPDVVFSEQLAPGESIIVTHEAR